MRAMILAAGRGERMRPLTDHTPKPLLAAGGKPLVVWHLERLAAAGLRDVVINHAWLGEQIVRQLGDGTQWGVRIQYSAEAAALETAGGIAQALPRLGDAPFLVINGDIWCDWNPAQAPALARRLDDEGADAWLLLTDNPAHHPAGDFTLRADGRAGDDEGTTGAAHPGAGQAVSARADSADGGSVHADARRLTFAGIGIYRPSLFGGLPIGQPAKLAPLLRHAMARDAVLASRHAGRWVDVGTPQRLAELDAALAASR
ncbi:N-acetylmuramate alpha-1-phosphate uridylyltransferase MurU [Bordetella genomosp. 13]|uniref:N-acetylmuramate alpha-1-phosphate uridylyltransferase MurU n=1 Tax=Bordetella genomosp. 13 TaxID=463040 RepID=UPI0011A07A85|nr:nucleotidyltransferase family protein [Bordetella genomosp. 13]